MTSRSFFLLALTLAITLSLSVDDRALLINVFAGGVCMQTVSTKLMLYVDLVIYIYIYILKWDGIAIFLAFFCM